MEERATVPPRRGRAAVLSGEGSDWQRRGRWRELAERVERAVRWSGRPNGGSSPDLLRLSSEDEESLGLRVLIFSWNDESVRLCGPGGSSLFFPCSPPDFFPALAELIVGRDPEVIVVGFQEDPEPGGHFHSHFLPAEMPKLGFRLAKRTKMMGVGVATVKALRRGQVKLRGIRVSVYVKAALLPSVLRAEEELRRTVPYDGQAEFVCGRARSKGATASYLVVPDYGALAFVCCHLPFDAGSLGNPEARRAALDRANACFNGVVEALYDSAPFPCDHLFLFGDLNYRVGPGGEELQREMVSSALPPLFEGVSRSGPAFAPTCKMRKGREPGALLYKIGKREERLPSWCDRILYSDFLTCLYYDRFDEGKVMTESDHAAVVGLFLVPRVSSGRSSTPDKTPGGRGESRPVGRPGDGRPGRLSPGRLATPPLPLPAPSRVVFQAPRPLPDESGEPCLRSGGIFLPAVSSPLLPRWSEESGRESSEEEERGEAFFALGSKSRRW